MITTSALQRCLKSMSLRGTEHSCGHETKVIGYEESEQLDVKPAQYFVRVTRREKRACKRCEENGAVTAPLPPRIIEKGLVSDELNVRNLAQGRACSFRQ